MNTIINSYKEYENWTNDRKGRFPAALYRGHERDSYLLLPTIARENLSKGQTLIYEERLAGNFQKAIIGRYIGDTKIEMSGNDFLPDWHLAFQMRHLEVPSRLIDFTFDEDVALYFAVSNTNAWDEDGHVWYFQSYDKKHNNVNQIEEVLNNNYIHTSAGEELQGVLSQLDPTHLDQVVLAHSLYDGIDFNRQTGNQRKFRQRGKFIVMKNEWIKYPMDGTFLSSMLEKVIIKAEAKQEMLNVLNAKGLNDDYLLPNVSPETKNIIDEIILKSRQEANLPI
jgi:hypothetical protein